MIVEVHRDIPYHGDSILLSFAKLADANDVDEYLTECDHEFVRVGNKGIWLCDPSALDLISGEFDLEEGR